MNLYQLRYFVTLAETKHFGKAAERLCIAQPSLSHAIAQLEAELGVVLFERKNRSSTLTKEGMQFLSYVEKSLEILDNGIETMAHISRGEGCIELGFLRTFAHSGAGKRLFTGAEGQAHSVQVLHRRDTAAFAGSEG